MTGTPFGGEGGCGVHYQARIVPAISAPHWTAGHRPEDLRSAGASGVDTGMTCKIINNLTIKKTIHTTVPVQELKEAQISNKKIQKSNAESGVRTHALSRELEDLKIG